VLYGLCGLWGMWVMWVVCGLYILCVYIILYRICVINNTCYIICVIQYGLYNMGYTIWVICVPASCLEWSLTRPPRPPDPPAVVGKKRLVLQIHKQIYICIYLCIYTYTITHMIVCTYNTNTDIVKHI
jgi:hypothetical protein